MITLDLRHAIGRLTAVGPGPNGTPDPGLRPGGEPGQYASSVAFGLASRAGGTPGQIAARLAARLEGEEPWIAKAAVTGQGYVTVTVTPEALGGVAHRVAAAGPGCVRSDALAGRTFAGQAHAAPWEEAATWDEARELLAAEVIPRLAEAAGAAAGEAGGASGIDGGGERDTPDGRDRTIRSGGGQAVVAAAVAFAGRDAVRFSLARAMPGQPVAIDPRMIARHHLANPAYAVRYAHARAASGVRWAAAANPDQAGPQRPSADPGEEALLDALSWLPERVATAARRGRPDEFARYLEHVADVTLAALTRAREQSP
ncbi:MAG: hypothetical protein J2P28_26565, partial [Actinobacteria bacterium]|nr:hypothetical protein [Actinomycetota bacterium]